MQIQCLSCHKRYNVPDERLPAGKKIAFPCPACKEYIKLDLRTQSTPAADTKSSQPPASAAAPPDQGEDLKKKILKSMKDLPPMPQVIMKARQVMADPNSSLKDIGNVLESDQAIAAMVLKMANSAFYGLIGMVSSIQHASVVLGHKTLDELITVAGTSQLLGSALKGYGMGSGDLWRHSLAVAFGSKIIADKNAPALSNDAFSAGLIHDAGKLVLDSHIQNLQPQFKALNGDTKTILFPAEKTVLGFDHAEIAFELCKQWNIPASQSEAIRCHHYPQLSQDNELAHILHLANCIAGSNGSMPSTEEVLNNVQAASLEAFVIEEPEIEAIKQNVFESVEKISEEIQA